MIGAMIGGWLGKKGAHSINTAELKRLQDELSKQIQVIQDTAKLAQENIQRYQEETTANISAIAYRENESFQSIKDDESFECYSEDTMLFATVIILRDYIAQLISDLKNGDETQRKHAQELEQYIPSNQQIKMYPKESLGLLLSSQKYIGNNMEEDYRCNSALMNEICIVFYCKVNRSF